MRILLSCAAVVAAAPAQAQTADPDPAIVIFGRAENLIGDAVAASEGTVGKGDFTTRPLSRTGELLEVVPGLIATQHSGAGKANQYFLRGFNLDHGTDFAGFFDGVPVNMRTHGHGQGYLDLGFIIPETVDRIDYSKGPYRAEFGDFATAGTGRFVSRDTFDAPFATLEIGEGLFARAVAGGSAKVGDGNLLIAAEARADDGRYDLEENARLFSGFAKYTGPVGGGMLRASLSAYHIDFDSSEQVPQRAIDAGLISPTGILDDELGGKTTRIAGNVQYTGDGDAPFSAQAYAHYYDFRLYSNFTYFLDDPVNGDEFEQADRRTVVGGRVDKRFAAGPVGLLVGGEARYDFIDRVGLYRTANRRRLSTVREDEVVEGSGALFAEATVEPLPGLRVTLGARGDIYDFDVEAEIPENSGRSDKAIFSPKASVAYAPVEQVELYANYGRGFHSNDARGTSINIDPSTGDQAFPVDPLVRAEGYEAGVRARPVEGLTLTASVWRLNLDSELLFIGDGGTTEPQGPSKRRGYELAAFWQPLPWLTLDAEYTYSRGRLTDLPRGADRIPGAIERVAAGGVVVQYAGVTGSLRVRHFGSVALVEDNSVRSDPTTVVNGRLAYNFGLVEIAATVLNILQSKDAEINYFYASRLPGEPEGGVEEIHLKPVEPRSVRVAATLRF